MPRVSRHSRCPPTLRQRRTFNCGGNLQPAQPGGRLSERNKMVLTFASVPHSSKTIRIISFNDVIDRRAPATLCQRRARAARSVTDAICGHYLR